MFSQARGEDEYSHLRRYAVRTREDTCFCERDRDSGAIEFTECSDQSLHAEIEAYVDQRVRSENSDGIGKNKDVDEEIEQRLSALGYK